MDILAQYSNVLSDNPPMASGDLASTLSATSTQSIVNDSADLWPIPKSEQKLVEVLEPM